MSKTKDELFRELYERYYDDVFRLLLRRSADRETARDLAQDTFIRVYEGWEGIRGDGPRTLLWVTAKRLWLNHLRGRATVKRAANEVSLDALPPSSKTASAPWHPAVGSPASQAHWNEQVSRLNEAIGQLSPKLRCYLLLRYRSGLTYKEIAEAMKVSPDTVKTQLHTARVQIQERLGDFTFEEPHDEP